MTTLTTPAPEIPRDRHGRPLVIPEGGGKPVPYTRCTTYVDCLDDKYNLGLWEKRMVALGLADRPDLMLSVAAHRDNKQVLNRICAEAKEAAAAHAAATTGTALHALTERIDRGLDVGVVPDAYLADLAAYTEATKDLTATHIEQFCVLDTLKIGGTPDRVVKYKGKKYIADLKTGSIKYGTGKIAMQLAVYARSKTYDVATGERGYHDADLTRGIVIHLPAGTGTCELLWVDLVKGWRGVMLAKQVREEYRSQSKSFITPFDAPPVDLTQSLSLEVPQLEELIAEAETDVALRELWAYYNPVWTDTLTELAKKRLAEIRGNPAA